MKLRAATGTRERSRGGAQQTKREQRKRGTEARTGLGLSFTKGGKVSTFAALFTGIMGITQP